MNVFEKLTAARLRFLNSEVKKSGHNSFANYDYFELGDILPVVNRAAKELGFCVVVNFGKEEATLDFIDIEKPEDRITFTSPMASADLKNNHPVQNLGAAETYIRRYLYLSAFEITESDGLDATAGAAVPQKQEAKPQASGKAEEMKRVLEESRYPDGSLVFSEEDKAYYRSYVKAKGCTKALVLLKIELRARLDCRADDGVAEQMRAVLWQKYPGTGEEVFSDDDRANYYGMWSEKGSRAALIAAKGCASERIQARQQDKKKEE